MRLVRLLSVGFVSAILGAPLSAAAAEAGESEADQDKAHNRDSSEAKRTQDEQRTEEADKQPPQENEADDASKSDPEAQPPEAPEAQPPDAVSNAREGTGEESSAGQAAATGDESAAGEATALNTIGSAEAAIGLGIRVDGTTAPEASLDSLATPQRGLNPAFAATGDYTLAQAEGQPAAVAPISSLAHATAEATPSLGRSDDASPDGILVLREPPKERPKAHGELLTGTRWATPFYRLDSGTPGPTVVVVSGVHGDEVAGPIAAERLLDVPLCAGMLYVLPRANQPALETGTRLTPLARHSNLNRNFPLEAPLPQGRLARHVWSLISGTEPDVVIDLHEGFDYNVQNRRSVGNTILYSPHDSEQTTQMVERMVDAGNRLEPDHDHRFRAWKPPVAGSLARAAAERLGAVAMIIETTTRTELDQRVAQHSAMVRTALSELGMIGDACQSDVTNVAVNPDSVSDESPESLDL